MPHFPRAVSAVFLLLALSACSVFGGPAAPEPTYSVVRSAEPFEIRDYPALAVVATPSAASALASAQVCPPQVSLPSVTRTIVPGLLV